MILEDVIAMDAPTDLVWSVTAQVERWPEWTPTVTAVRRDDPAPFGLGSVVRIKQPGQPWSAWTVTEWKPGERFSWETRRPGLWMKATHALTPAAGGTRNRLRLEARGVLALVLWPVLWLGARWALSRENRGLKACCEKKAREAGGDPRPTPRPTWPGTPGGAT